MSDDIDQLRSFFQTVILTEESSAKAHSGWFEYRGAPPLFGPMSFTPDVLAALGESDAATVLQKGAALRPTFERLAGKKRAERGLGLNELQYTLY